MADKSMLMGLLNQSYCNLLSSNPRRHQFVIPVYEQSYADGAYALCCGIEDGYGVLGPGFPGFLVRVAAVQMHDRPALMVHSERAAAQSAALYQVSDIMIQIKIT